MTWSNFSGKCKGFHYKNWGNFHALNYKYIYYTSYLVHCEVIKNIIYHYNVILRVDSNPPRYTNHGKKRDTDKNT